MTIYDREYYRRDGPSFLGSLAQHGLVCKWIILINVVVFAFQLFTKRSEQNLTPYLTLSADQFLQGEVWRLLTYGFAHSPNNLMHVLFNMLFLWWFGSELEDVYGPR